MARHLLSTLAHGSAYALGTLLLALPTVALAQSTGIEDPLKGVGSLEALVTNVVVRGFFPMLGMAAFVVVLWGAFQWITAGGSSERVKLGKDTFLWVVLGLALAFGGYVVLKFVIDTFLGATAVK